MLKRSRIDWSSDKKAVVTLLDEIKRLRLVIWRLSVIALIGTIAGLIVGLVMP